MNIESMFRELTAEDQLLITGMINELIEKNTERKIRDLFSEPTTVTLSGVTTTPTNIILRFLHEETGISVPVLYPRELNQKKLTSLLFEQWDISRVHNQLLAITFAIDNKMKADVVVDGRQFKVVI